MSNACSLCGRKLNEGNGVETMYGPVGDECFRKIDTSGFLLKSEFEKMSPKLQDELGKKIKDIKSTLSSEEAGTLASAFQYLRETKNNYKIRYQDFPGLFLFSKLDPKLVGKRDPSDYRLDLVMPGINTMALAVGTDTLPPMVSVFLNNMEHGHVFRQFFLDKEELISNQKLDDNELARYFQKLGLEDASIAYSFIQSFRASRMPYRRIAGMTLDEIREMANNPDVPSETRKYYSQFIDYNSDADPEKEVQVKDGFFSNMYLDLELSTREWNQVKPDDNSAKSLAKLATTGKISKEDYNEIQDAFLKADERFMRERGTLMLAHSHTYNVFGDGIDNTSSKIPREWENQIVSNNNPVRLFKKSAHDCVASIKDIELSVANKKKLALHSSSLMFMSPCWKELEDKGYMGAILQMKDGNVMEMSLIKKPTESFESVYAPSTAQEVFNSYLKKYPAIRENPFGKNKDYEYLILAPGPVSETKKNKTDWSPLDKKEDSEFLQVGALHLFALHASPRMSPEKDEEGTHLTQVAYTIQAPQQDAESISPLRWHAAVKPMFGGSGARFAPTIKAVENHTEIEKIFDDKRVIKNINDSLDRADFLTNKKVVSTPKEFIQNELRMESKSLGDKLHTYSLSSAVLEKRNGNKIDASEITDQKELEKFLAGHFGTNSATARLGDAITRSKTGSDMDPNFKNITSSIKRLPEVFSAAYYIREGRGIRGYKNEDVFGGLESTGQFYEKLTKPMLSRWKSEGKEKEAFDAIKKNAASRRRARFLK